MLLTEEQYMPRAPEHGDDFDAAMGAEAVFELLRAIDLQAEMVKLKRRSPPPTVETKLEPDQAPQAGRRPSSSPATVRSGW